MPPTPKPPTVEYRHNVARARHELGVRLNGTFVPFVTVDDARLEQLLENAASTAENEDEDGGEA